MKTVLSKEDPLVTDLVGSKTTKLDSREHFLGACDELQAHLMNVKLVVKEKEDIEWLAQKMSVAMGEIAGGKGHILEEDVMHLWDLIHSTEENNGIITTFILPGQTEAGARINIARTVARRCELEYAKVYKEYETSKILFQFLNKISTYLYDLVVRYDK